MYTNLATQAAQTEKAYKIALDGLNNLLEEVDANLREVIIEETFLGTTYANKEELPTVMVFVSEQQESMLKRKLVEGLTTVQELVLTGQLIIIRNFK